MAAFNIDESPLNRDWIHSKWRAPAYRSAPFFEWLKKAGQTISHFKQSAMYKQAVEDGTIVKDEWVPTSRRS